MTSALNPLDLPGKVAEDTDSNVNSERRRFPESSWSWPLQVRRCPSAPHRGQARRQLNQRKASRGRHTQ